MFGKPSAFDARSPRRPVWTREAPEPVEVQAIAPETVETHEAGASIEIEGEVLDLTPGPDGTHGLPRFVIRDMTRNRSYGGQVVCDPSTREGEMRAAVEKYNAALGKEAWKVFRV